MEKYMVIVYYRGGENNITGYNNLDCAKKFASNMQKEEVCVRKVRLIEVAQVLDF